MVVPRGHRAGPRTVPWLVVLSILLNVSAVTTTTTSSTTTTTTVAPTTTTKTPKTTTTTTSQPPTPAPTTTTTVKTTTTTPAPPTLGADCSTQASDWCSAITGAACNSGLCSCIFPIYFKFNDTTCLPETSLKPEVTISVVSQGSNSLTATWTLDSRVTSLILLLDYNVQARNVDNSSNTVTCSVQSSTTLSSNCSALTSGAKYNVTVEVSYTVDGTNFSQFDSIQESLFPAQPGAIVTTNQTWIAPDVTWSWQPSAGKVELYRVIVKGTNYYETATSGTTSLTVTGLLAGTVYNIEIYASSYGKLSTQRIGQIRTITEVPGPPTGLTASDLRTNSIQLSWTAPSDPNGYITGYKLCYTYKVYDEYGADPTCENLTDATEYTASSLLSGTSYKFYVFTINDMYYSTDNASTTSNTLETVPEKVFDLKAVPENTSVSLTWKRPNMPNGRIVAYKATWYKTGESDQTSFCLTTSEAGNLGDLCSSNSTDSNHTVNQKELRYLINNVAPFTEYTINVIAYTKEGAGTTASTTIYTNIVVPDAVTDVIATVLNSTAVEVSWIIPKTYPGPVNYTVSTHDLVFGNISDQICEVSNFNSSNCIVDGLEEYWRYKFGVVAKTESGESSEEVSNETRTEPGKPGKVSYHEITKYDSGSSGSCDATMVTIHWKEADLLDRNSRITSYTFEDAPSNNEFMVDSPLPYAVENRRFRKDFMVEAETNYSWKLFAVEENMVSGVKTSIDVSTGSCPPPDWSKDDLNQITYTRQSTTSSVTIKLQDSLFNNEQQGKITNKGLVVIPEASTFYQGSGSIIVGNVENWKTSSLSGFQREYKIKFTSFTTRMLQALTSVTVGADGTFTIGEDVSCKSESIQFCNGPLPNSWTFKLAIYSCTKPNMCRVSSYVGPFVTAVPQPDEESSKAWIIPVALLVVILALVGSFVFLWWRGIIDPKQWIGKKDPKTEERQTTFTTLDKKIHQPRPIKVADYFSVLEEMHRDTNLQFSDQYDDISKLGEHFKEQSTTNAAKHESNTAKNRWVNILPYDHSRVKLQQIDDDDPTSDYINANYMPGFNTQREYIATQGPLPGTVDDFWRLVWEQNVQVIVMLTQCKEGNRQLGEENLQVKCEKYWPDELREPKQYGEVVVNPVSISQLDKYNISIFYVSVNNSTRQVIHFHYLDFPDFSANVEFDHFIEFVRTVRNHVPHDMSGPMIVHCSAGVGRTGTFIGVDRLQLYLNSPQFDENDNIDIFDMVVGLRKNRVYMVQTESQYIMIHDCFEKMLADKKAALQVSDSMENLYANQAFDSYPEVVYENVESNGTQQRTEL